MNRMSKKAASAVTAAFMLQVFSPLCTVSAETVLSDEEAEVSFEAEVSEGDPVDIDSVNFPDDTFRKYVSDNFDTDKDGKLSRAEAEDVYTIDVSGTYDTPGTVADLTGIGYFTKLEKLYCGNNQLTSLDLSKNTALKYLGCFENQITSLDVSENTALEYLSCDINQLTSLDVSNNTALDYLSCDSNQLTSLDVSRNTALEYLSFYRNQLTSLDLSKNTALEYLRCDFNQLTSLDISNNTALEFLKCDGDQLTRLDVSNNTALIYLSCDSNRLTSLDVSNNTALTDLYCSSNQLTRLDVSNNTALTRLECSSNRLTSLDVSNNTALIGLDCSYNTYTIFPKNGSFALSDLPKGFDASRASEWTGATYDSATKSLNNFTGVPVTFTYDLGNGKTSTFTLKFTFVNNVSVSSNGVAVKYRDNTSKTYSFDEVTEEIVNFMTENDMRSCVDFVNAFSGKGDTMILTAAQLKAVEAVLESDYGV